MDAFFSGLDSRLRMSVKVADSIMMGLVNAAMEDAYKKSLWKDGDLERLFQKLRFAELAIMQLEWCLRFVRGEMEADGGVDDGHEQLLDDLLETRDRIQTRLDEAELAVADKDRDYMRRKHEELISSRRETAPADSEHAGPGHDVEEGCAFGELKGSVDRQMARMRIRLEDARSTLAALMQKVSGEASPMARLQEAGHEGDGVKGLSGFYSMAQLLMEFQEMVLEAGTVRDSVASSFDMMERSVSSLMATIDEQQWLANAEKEMYGTVIEGFLREINVVSPVLKNGSSSPGEGSQPLTAKSWEETDSLKDETGQLQSTRRVPEKSDSGQCWHSEEPGMSHEEVERLIEEKIDSEIKCGLQDVLYASMFRDLVRKLAVQEEAQKLKEEKDELDIRSKLHCEIYYTIFKDLVNKLAVESAEHLIRTLIKDEVHTVLVAKTLKEWKSTAEMVHNERLIKEEIDCIVFGELTKDLAQKHDLSVFKSSDEIKGSNNLGRFIIIDNFEQLQKMKTQIYVTSEDKGVDSNKHQVPVKQEILSSSGNCDGEDSKESGLQAELSTDKDGVSDVEQALEQQDHRKLHTGDVASLSTPPEGANLENGLVALILDEKHGTRHSLATNARIGEHDPIPFTNFQKIFMDFEAFTGGKIGTAMLRLRDLDEQLANLIEQVSSLKRSELIYRRAFTKRCQDLQTAETEVDLLGDEVELLLGLLSKTYKALDHYSPVLRHYLGIREMLTLLGKELAVRHQSFLQKHPLVGGETGVASPRETTALSRAPRRKRRRSSGVRSRLQGVVPALGSRADPCVTDGAREISRPPTPHQIASAPNRPPTPNLPASSLARHLARSPSKVPIMSPPAGLRKRKGSTPSASAATAAAAPSPTLGRGRCSAAAAMAPSIGRGGGDGVLPSSPSPAWWDAAGGDPSSPSPGFGRSTAWDPSWLR